ncbi:MAG: Na+/H+ antiporter NhaA [Proteobacteria bacterium]|nr:Na+/H+ antiporter NhaA [Cystobacterineae bacterium]MCL2258556.1 Na+/H+ antiporter NhaA [Cystobacterineae bacterium]MCL2315134.1 Na+/H+ antiporter NhaA [Pseudomonadota bacterium]
MAPYKNLPRGTSVRAKKVVKQIFRPLERFLQMEASSGLVLLAVTAIALFWANSSWSDSYFSLWEYKLGLSFGEWNFERDVRFWINDGLMTFFFFVVGLELRREFVQGDLSEFKRATLPLMAALGGMVAPALIYFAFNKDLPSARGWGIPMGTDTAFALGILAILGKRVPAAARILLLGLAVIDDVGGILVIAFFYSSGIQYGGLVLAFLAFILVLFMQNIGIRSRMSYLIPGVMMWVGIYYAGIHPTLTGVVLGFLTPARPGFTPEKILELTKPYRQELVGLSEESNPSTEAMMSLFLSLRDIYREGLSFVDQLIQKLHGTVAYIIMPLFALANAGVIIGGTELGGEARNVFWGVVLGLVVGKPLGIFLTSLLAIKLGFSKMPVGIGYKGIFQVGMVGGIGFTMALFIAQLAFPSGDTLEVIKQGVLSASLVAAVVSLVTGFLWAPKVQPEASSESA